MTSVVPPTQRRYPHAARQDVSEDLHGERVADPYRWLEDAEAEATARWSDAQDALYEAERASWPGLAQWHDEVTRLTAVSRAMSPKVCGDRVFWRRRAARQEHPVLAVAEGATERVLLDPSVLDPTGHTVLDAWQPSLEGELLAYQVSSNGTEDSQLLVIEVATGKVVDGPVRRVRRSPVAWLPGGGAFYYVRHLDPLDPTARPNEARYHRRVYLHRVGTAPEADVPVFGEGRERTQFYSVSVTSDGRWLGVTATLGTGRGTDLYLADLTLDPPDRPRLRPVQEGRDAATRLHAVPDTGPDDPVWLRTDRDAPRGRVVACRPADAHLGPDAWREVIAERPDAVLTHLLVLSGPELDRPVGLVAWTRHMAAEVTAHDLVDGRLLATVPLPGVGAVGDFSAGPHGSHQAWFAYTDFGTPPLVLRFDARTLRVTRWERDPGEAPDRHGAVTRQIAFPSSDGTTVRMFVISPTGRPDTPRPTLLAGYGGFAQTMSPRYRAQILAWVRAGGAFAWAGLRGGGEEGEEWHRAGSGAHKQNSFDDFAAAARHLVTSGWAAEGRLGIIGGSNGGLLVGAALTQWPGSFAAVVCMSPLLDMVRYEGSGLGPSWVPEYGSASVPDQLRTLLSYSPYHRVTPGTAYPAVLLTASDGDTRTDPLHARKMCAALQHATSGPGPVLLRREHGVGHGDRAASSAVALRAECLAFLAAHLGLAAPAERGREGA
ncbi:prolyl oligopeptidase family serine peptidase [Streptomyces profundus]|uniref:prolyl oligopeptidase family serine peptidase n=1 Tax=Streptomyces profundus TaxID=2867410 RepID=UPI001D15EFAA|nr:prolyl oligopeptidase family serine peptidase [Streptomyces sp. MA3_2.13]UED85104.1 prolyl oligopeptidase family serine peptidase [Streptomyces sp. MA3_2.13]